MKVNSYFNNFHLGDCIQNILYLNWLYKTLDDEVIFYCNETHHQQLQEIITANITLKSLALKTESANDLWCNADNNFYKLCNQFNNDTHAVFAHIYNCPKHVFIPDLNSFKHKYKTLNNNKKKVLLINSTPHSGQADQNVFNNFINNNLQRYSHEEIITTQEIKRYSGSDPLGVLDCTQHYNMSVLDIAYLSTTVDKIIAIDTGPIHLCLNKQNMEREVPIYIHHNLKLIPNYKNIYLI